MDKQTLFKNPKLSLNDLAAHLDSSSHQISKVINSGFEMNFNDFINHYRIAAVKEMLANQEHKQMTLLAIALECGFNSKTTFNRVFKKHVGITPKQYLKSISDKE